MFHFMYKIYEKLIFNRQSWVTLDTSSFDDVTVLFFYLSEDEWTNVFDFFVDIAGSSVKGFVRSDVGPGSGKNFMTSLKGINLDVVIIENFLMIVVISLKILLKIIKGHCLYLKQKQHFSSV